LTLPPLAALEAVGDETGLLDRHSLAVLRRHSVLYLANALLLHPMPKALVEAPCLTAWGGDQLFTASDGLLAQRRKASPKDLLRLAYLVRRGLRAADGSSPAVPSRRLAPG